MKTEIVMTKVIRCKRRSVLGLYSEIHIVIPYALEVK